MTGYLLDTNVVSELRKRDRANDHLRAWFATHHTDEFWLSVLVVGELKRGIELINRRDPAAADALRTWLDHVIDDYSDRILPITMAITTRWAAISVPDPIPVIDGLLASTALEHDLTLVTCNTTDIARTEVTQINPFE